MSLVGLRVLRGPDWSHGDIDGGDGHIGTIVNVGGLNTADVVWDNGQHCVCRIGENGQHDLRVLDNGTVGICHTQFVCSSCSERGIFGMRWKCKQCDDINLCPICYVTDKHDINHQFLRFDTPESQGEDVPKRSSSVKSQAIGIFPGATVKRGTDWMCGNQDGGDGKTGEVIDIKNNEGSSTVRNIASVKWNSTGDTNSYRLGGIDGKVDLMFVEQCRGPHYYRDHLPVCEKEAKKKNYNTTRQEEEVSDVLKEGDRVCIMVSIADLKELQKQHGGFTSGMSRCTGKIGKIISFNQNKDAAVKFDDIAVPYVFHPGVLKKVPKLDVGDMVRIMSDEEKVQILQENHGDYNAKMKHYLGKIGQVIKKDSDGDVIVKFSKRIFVYNPACCIPAPGESVADEDDEEDKEEENDISDSGLSDLNNALLMLMGGLIAGRVTQEIPKQALYAAIATNDINMVRRVLNDHPDLANAKLEGLPPLALAANQGHRDIVLALLNKGADINAVDHVGHPPVIAAVVGKQQATAKLLIEKGADVNIVDNNGRNVLHGAALLDYDEVLQMALKKGCDPNQQENDGDTPLHNAIGADSPKSIPILCNASNLDVTIVNQKSFNVLHAASFHGRSIATDKLLDRFKSLVNSKTNDGFTPLHIAAVNNHVECAKLLIEKGKADVNSKNLTNITPLHLAAIEGYIETAELLLDKKADINAVDRNKCTPLHAACIGKDSQSDASSQLLAALLGVSIQSTKERRLNVAKFLVKKGAKTDTKDVKGKTPLEACSDNDMKSALANFLGQRGGGTGASFSGSSGQSETLADMMGLPCRKCQSRPTEITLLPCGHKSVCRQCATTVNKCPLCDAVILKRVATGMPRGENCNIQ